MILFPSHHDHAPHDDLIFLFSVCPRDDVAGNKCSLTHSHSLTWTVGKDNN